MTRNSMSALALSLVSGCASYQGSATDADPGEISREKGWLLVNDVPEVRQTGEHDCGAAAMVAMLSYWQKPAKISDVKTENGRTRLSAGELRKFAKRRGFDAFAIHGTFDDLKHELSEGRPVEGGQAVLQRQGSRSLPGGSRAEHETAAGAVDGSGNGLSNEHARGLR